MRSITPRGRTFMLVGAYTCVAVIILIALQRSRAEVPASNPPSDVNKLQEERLSTLKEAQAIAGELYGRGTGTLEDVNRCNRSLAEAELEAAQSAKVRLEILRAAVASATKAEELADQRHKAGLCSRLEPLEAKAYRLRTEIDLAREIAKR
jgi:outer membrane protein TolC